MVWRWWDPGIGQPDGRDGVRDKGKNQGELMGKIDPIFKGFDFKSGGRIHEGFDFLLRLLRRIWILIGFWARSIGEKGTQFSESLSRLYFIILIRKRVIYGNNGGRICRGNHRDFINH